MRAEEMNDALHQEAERRVRSWRLQTGLAWAAFAAVLLHMVYLLVCLFYMIWMGGYIRFMLELSVLAAHLAVMLVLASAAGRASGKIYGILSRECEPYLYESCIYLMGFWGNTSLKQLKLAEAQYYQGNFDQEEETLRYVSPRSFKKTDRLHYYLLQCGCCFRHGAGEKVRELEDEFQRQISGKEDARNMQILCAVNNINRARQNRDYDAAWRFFYEWLRLTGKKPHDRLYHVQRAWQAGILEKESGSPQAARAAFSCVKQYGGRLMYAGEAENYLNPESREGETEDGRNETEGKSSS